MSDLSFLEPWFQFFTTDVALRVMQIIVLLTSSILVFLVFYTTRDIMLRTNSFLYQVGSIVLVAIFPFFGFLAYLLVRPARTCKERETEAMLKKLVSKHGDAQGDKKHPKKEKSNEA